MKCCSEEDALCKVRALRSIRTMVAEVQNISIRLLNCLECMRITPDFMEIAPAVRNVLIAQIDDCLLSDTLTVKTALEISVGYAQGACRMLRLAVEESLCVPAARIYFLRLVRELEEKAVVLKRAQILWERWGLGMAIVFVLPMILFVGVILYIGTILPHCLRFFLHLTIIFFLSMSVVRLFERSDPNEIFSFLPKKNMSSIDALVVRKETASYLYVYLTVKGFCKEEKFLNFMSTFFHGKIVVHKSLYESLGRKSFRIQFRKPRISYAFVQDILHIISGFFGVFSREPSIHGR